MIPTLARERVSFHATATSLILTVTFLVAGVYASFKRSPVESDLDWFVPTMTIFAALGTCCWFIEEWLELRAIRRARAQK